MNVKGLIFPHPNHYSGLDHPSPQGRRPGGEGSAGTYRRLRSVWNLGSWARRLRSQAGDNRGAILLETVIASTVFAMVGVAVLSGLDMIYTHGARVEARSTSEIVARNQLEDVFSQEYLEPLTPYPTSVGVPAGYAVTVITTNMPTPDPNIEKLTVTVSHDGANIMSIDTIRFNNP